jgi:hypothetical protein
MRKKYFIFVAGIIVALGVCFGIYKYLNQQSIIRPGDTSKGEYEFALYYKGTLIKPACILNFLSKRYEVKKEIDEDYFGSCLEQTYENGDVFLGNSEIMLNDTISMHPFEEVITETQQHEDYWTAASYGYDKNSKKLYLSVIINGKKTASAKGYILKFCIEKFFINMRTVYQKEIYNTH